MKNLRYTLLVIVTASVWLVSCDKDCPTCPEPDDGRSQGRAYIAIPDGINGIYVIDLGTDSVVDSVKFGEDGGGIIRVTADGRFVLASATDDIFRVFDARDMSTVSTVPAFGLFELIRSDSAILGQYSDEFTVYSLPDLDTILHAQLPLRSTRYHYSESRREVYTLRGSDTLVAISVDSLVIVDQWLVRSGGVSQYYLNNFTIGSDGQLAYFAATGQSSALFITYNLETRQIVATHPINGPVGRIAVSPDGKEVWITDPWTSRTPWVSNGIWVFDGRTGQFKRTISLVGYLPGDPLEPLIARAIEFTPDGKNVIVGTGDYLTQRGTVLRISTLTNTVEKIYFPDFQRYPYDIAVGKKP